jgi:hypothetical protein
MSPEYRDTYVSGRTKDFADSDREEFFVFPQSERSAKKVTGPSNSRHIPHAVFPSISKIRPIPTIG